MGARAAGRGYREISRFEDGCPRAARRPLALALHCVNTFSKNCSARGSFDCPSQNMACFRTAGFRLVCATSINLGTPSSFGNWLSAKTAFFFTSVSGSFSIAPVIVPTAFFPAFCQPEKRLPTHVGTGVIMGHANHLLDGAGFVADGQRKSHVRADVGVRITLGHL